MRDPSLASVKLFANHFPQRARQNCIYVEVSLLGNRIRTWADLFIGLRGVPLYNRSRSVLGWLLAFDLCRISLLHTSPFWRAKVPSHPLLSSRRNLSFHNSTNWLEIERRLAALHVKGDRVMLMRNHPLLVNFAVANGRPPPHIELTSANLSRANMV